MQWPILLEFSTMFGCCLIVDLVIEAENDWREQQPQVAMHH